MVLGQYGAVLVGTWWYLVNMGRYWLVYGGTRSVWGGTYWYMVVVGQYNLVLIGIKWYLVRKVLLCLYIVKKWRFGRVLPMPDRLTDRQQNIGLCYVSIFLLLPLITSLFRRNEMILIILIKNLRRHLQNTPRNIFCCRTWQLDWNDRPSHRIVWPMVDNHWKPSGHKLSKFNNEYLISHNLSNIS